MRVIIINGPMGVGKTTVGKLIADKVPGTAFIDGDWCMDIHPFIGNRETKEMAADNILHMIGNYNRCSVCGMVVLVWLMDDARVLKSILDGLSEMDMQAKVFTLICDENELVKRWKNDRTCEWRTDEWLDVSLRSLPYFRAAGDTVDTGGRSPESIADTILRKAAE
ncbi:MAG: AAA family ATPase [Clostridia bacterium]|nr:AAA family ATPase [Clostridia bacterium]